MLRIKLTNCWIRHDHHDICIRCQKIDEGRELRISYFHALKLCHSLSTIFKNSQNYSSVHIYFRKETILRAGKLKLLNNVTNFLKTVNIFVFFRACVGNY